jgi:hypothetical protein
MGLADDRRPAPRRADPDEGMARLLELSGGLMVDGALMAVLSKLSYAEPKTADQVFKMINWWTPETVLESLDHLVVTGQAKAIRAKDGTRRFALR